MTLTVTDECPFGNVIQGAIQYNTGAILYICMYSVSLSVLLSYLTNKRVH